MGLKINGIPVAGLGLPGKQGEIGPKGEPGKSAYQSAVDGGYQGTEQEFNEFLATMKSSVNADWSQNDETAGDYIKNRTHYIEEEVEILFPEESFTASIDEWEQIRHDSEPNENLSNITYGDIVTVTFDGVDYITEVTEAGAYGSHFMGGFKAGYPFEIYSTPWENELEIYCAEEGEHSYSIKRVTETVHKLDPKYLPDGIGVQSNWSQNDENAVDYVKNRTHWVENPTAEIFVNNNIENTGSEVYRYEFIHPFKYDDIGKIYTVVYCGNEYQLQLADMSGDGFQLYNEDPYLSLQFYPELLEIWVNPENPVVDKYEVAVYDGSAAGEIVHPLDPKFVTSITETNKGLEQKFWRGTKEEFDAVETKDENTMYIITDDNGKDESGTPIYIGENEPADELLWVDTKDESADIEIENAVVTSFNGRGGNVVPEAGDYTAEMVGAQPKITGTAGQFVVIGEDGNVTTKTIANAEEASF